MIKTNLPNATRRNPMSGFTRPAYNAALRIFCATLGLTVKASPHGGSARACLHTFPCWGNLRCNRGRVRPRVYCFGVTRS